MRQTDRQTGLSCEYGTLAEGGKVPYLLGDCPLLRQCAKQAAAQQQTNCGTDHEATGSEIKRNAISICVALPVPDKALSVHDAALNPTEVGHHRCDMEANLRQIIAE